MWLQEDYILPKLRFLVWFFRNSLVRDTLSIHIRILLLKLYSEDSDCCWLCKCVGI